MDLHHELLEKVIASPNDDAPRLEYADYLDRQGEAARAEFIRLQCSLDLLPRDDSRIPALRERESELLTRFGWDWAEYLGADVTEWVYRRGFIERVQMCLETSGDKIREILAKAPIRHIRDVTQFCELGGVLDALPDLERLTGLEFWWLYAFDDDAMVRLLSSPHLRNLRTLVLHHDRNGNLVDERIIIAALHSPYRANVEELAVNVDCSWRGPSNAILEAIADSPYLRRLRNLNLSNAGDTGNDPQLTLDAVRRLAASPNMACLKVLDLRHVHATAEVWRAILAMPQLPRLTKLYLGGATEVTTPWIPIIGHLADMPEWRSAFEERAPAIDWETQFIDPSNHPTWKGQSWKGRDRQYLFGMNAFVRARDYDGLEQRYAQVCRQLEGDEITDEIRRLSFDSYRQALASGLEQAVAAFQGGPTPPPEILQTMMNGLPEEFRGLAAMMRESISAMPRDPARAIYLRLRTDLNWRGHFHVTDKLPEQPLPCAEGGYELPIAEYSAGEFPEAGAILNRHHRANSTNPSGPLLYLLARTIAALGRAAARIKPPVPLYFSCFNAVFKI